MSWYPPENGGWQNGNAKGKDYYGGKNNKGKNNKGYDKGKNNNGGGMWFGGSAAPDYQQAPLPVASDNRCQSVNGYMVRIDPTSMICAGGQGRGGCQGDSGGPFVCNEGGRWVLRGAVSWGHKMCRTDHFTVFARVSSFIGWINQRIG